MLKPTLSLKETSLSMFTNKEEVLSTTTGFRLADLAIPTLTSGSVGWVINSKSENSLNPEGWIKDLTGSFHLS